MDIRREILGTEGILQRSVNDVVALVENKEMARNALPSTAASISTFRRQKTVLEQQKWDRNQSAPCPDCGKNYSLFSEGPSGWNKRPHKQCLECYRAKRNRNRQSGQKSDNRNGNKSNGTSSSEVGGMFTQISTISSPIQECRDIVVNSKHKTGQKMNTDIAQPFKFSPSNHVFSKGEWRRARFLNHPEVQLTVSSSASDYKAFGRKCCNVQPTLITAMADSGAQSCLWSLDGFRAAGFSTDYLVPVNMDLVAANKSPISIDGAALLHLEGLSPNGRKVSCASMVYISKQARGFYLSREAMMDLGIIPHDFPAVGSAETDSNIRIMNAGCSEPASDGKSPCTCPDRTAVPDLPTELPFECTEANNDKMKQWLLDYFGSSTFNTCPHHPLPCMDGPPVEIHVSDNVSPKAIHTPEPVPLHW